MYKIYSLILDGEDQRLENGEFIVTEAEFTDKEVANKVCEFLNTKLSTESEDTFIFGGNKYYISDCVYQRYSVHETVVYESIEEYRSAKNETHYF